MDDTDTGLVVEWAIGTHDWRIKWAVVDEKVALGTQSWWIDG